MPVRVCVQENRHAREGRGAGRHGMCLRRKDRARGQASRTAANTDSAGKAQALARGGRHHRVVHIPNGGAANRDRRAQAVCRKRQRQKERADQGISEEAEMTKKQAKKLYDSKFWTGMTFKERAIFQLFEDRLCMPFDVFHEAVEKALGRPVWTHEFAYAESLRKELLGEKPRPTFEEILNLIPKEK